MELIYPVDGFDYHLIAEAVLSTKNVPGFTCEIGVREGGCSELIMRMIAESGVKRTHLGIDPYGNIEYATDQFTSEVLDYTNEMRNRAMITLYNVSNEIGIDYIPMIMEDTEFFKRFADGVPLYDGHKTIENRYSLVHFDGPHTYDALVKEIEFFAPRASQGAFFVFDDVSFYDHKKIEGEYLVGHGWSFMKGTQYKACYAKL